MNVKELKQRRAKLLKRYEYPGLDAYKIAKSAYYEAYYDYGKQIAEEFRRTHNREPNIKERNKIYLEIENKLDGEDDVDINWPVADLEQKYIDDAIELHRKFAQDKLGI